MRLTAGALGQAAGLLGWRGEVVDGVAEGDRRLSAVVALDRPEIARRDGQRPVTDRVLLSALMNLPLGFEVPWSEIGSEVRTIIALAPDHTVERSAHGVIRTFTPALSLAGLFGIKHTRRDAIAEVSLYAAEAPRAAVLGRAPTADQRLRAHVMGIGLCHVGTSGVALDVGAEHRMVSPGPLRWQLQELVFGAWLAQEGRLIPTH